MQLQPGDKAPDFEMYADDRKLYRLDDFGGENLLLLFFPAAFSSTCTKEMGMVLEASRKYRKRKLKIAGVSVDSPWVLAKYRESEHLDFPLLSDFNKEASKAYGAYYENFMFNMKGVSRRAAFVIDKNGIIRYAEVLEDADTLPNFTAIQEIIESQG